MEKLFPIFLAVARKRSLWRLSFYSAAALLIYLAITAGSFRYQSVCDKCGAIKNSTDWNIPFTSWCLFTQANEAETELSRVLADLKLVPPHQHHWLFASGAGNGAFCAIGPGRHLRQNINDRAFSSLIARLSSVGQSKFRDKLLTIALNPDQSLAVRMIWLDAPANSLISDWNEWVKEASETVDRGLEIRPR